MIRAICTILLLTIAMPAWAEKLTLASTYDEVATNPNGSKYTGTATVEVISDTTFLIKWKIGSTTYSGFGMRMNDTLAATYLVNGEPGLIIYQVGDNGVLSGLWAIRGQTATAPIASPHATDARWRFGITGPDWPARTGAAGGCRVRWHDRARPGRSSCR